MSKFLPSDQLLSYQPLFIKDVTTADIQADQPLTLKTKRHLVFQKVKVNGLIVSRQENHGNKMGNAPRCVLFLDDGSAVIPVHLPQRIYNRKDTVYLIMAVSVTILGEPQIDNNSIILLCKGFHIENDPAAELYHSLQVLSNHNDRIKAKNHTLPSTSSCYISNGRKRQKRSDSNLFNTLSSQPSPIRGSIEDLYPSPIRNNSSRDDLGPVIHSQSSKEAPWHWSPDHIAATSTPIKNSILSSPKYPRSSPLRLSQKITMHPSPSQQQSTGNHNIKHAFINDDDDDDDFGFDSQFDALDFDDIEKKALEARAAAMK